MYAIDIQELNERIFEQEYKECIFTMEYRYKWHTLRLLLINI